MEIFLWTLILQLASIQLFYSFAVATCTSIFSIQSHMIGWPTEQTIWMMNIAERRSAPHSAPVRELRSTIAALALMWCKYLQISSVRLCMSRGERVPAHYQESAKLKMACLKQRFLWILPDLFKICQMMPKIFWQNRPQNFLPKASKLCPIFKIWQKLCQIDNAGLNVVHARLFISRAASRFSSLIGYCDDVVKRHHVEFGLFGVASNSGYVFYHNSDCVLLLFVFVRLDQKYYFYFYLNC